MHSGLHLNIDIHTYPRPKSRMQREAQRQHDPGEFKKRFQRAPRLPTGPVGSHLVPKTTATPSLHDLKGHLNDKESESSRCQLERCLAPTWLSSNDPGQFAYSCAHTRAYRNKGRRKNARQVRKQLGEVWVRRSGAAKTGRAQHPNATERVQHAAKQPLSNEK